MQTHRSALPRMVVIHLAFRGLAPYHPDIRDILALWRSGVLASWRQ